MPMAARSKAWVYGCSLAGIWGSNPAGNMDVCLLWELCVVRWRFLRRTDDSSRSPTECDRAASIMWKPWPNWGFCANGRGGGEDDLVCTTRVIRHAIKYYKWGV